MKVLPFTIPVAHDHSIIVQDETLPHFYPYLHRHAEVQVTWIQQGEGTLLAGNGMHPFHEGEIYLFGANLPHLFKSDPTYFLPESTKVVKTVTLFFNPEGKLQALFELPEMKTLKAFIIQWQIGYKAQQESSDILAQKIRRLQNAAGAERLALFIGLLHTLQLDEGLIPLGTGSYSYNLTDPEGLRIAAVYNYIMQNYNGDLALADVAAQAHLTPTAFCRYFKKHTRNTFVHFVNKIRVNEACRQLTNGSQNSIATVAYGCGFNSITNFNYIFKRITGLSPREYLAGYEKTVRR
jgi:AraC-like DNA-binding protein